MTQVFMHAFVCVCVEAICLRVYISDNDIHDDDGDSYHDNDNIASSRAEEWLTECISGRSLTLSNSLLEMLILMK